MTMDACGDNFLAGLAIGGLGAALFFRASKSADLGEDRDLEKEIYIKDERCPKTEQLMRQVGALQIQLMAGKQHKIDTANDKRKMEEEFSKLLTEIAMLRSLLENERYEWESTQQENRMLTEKVQQLEEDLGLKIVKEQGTTAIIVQLKNGIDNIKSFYSEMFELKQVLRREVRANQESIVGKLQLFKDSYTSLVVTNVGTRRSISDSTLQTVDELKARREIALLQSRLTDKEAAIQKLQTEKTEQQALINQLMEKLQKQTVTESLMGGGEGSTEDGTKEKTNQLYQEIDPHPELIEEGSVVDMSFDHNADYSGNSSIGWEQVNASQADMKSSPLATTECLPKKTVTGRIKSSPRSPILAKFWKRKSKKSKSDTTTNACVSSESSAKKEYLI